MPLGDESGQSLVFTALMTGLVVIFLALGAIGAAFLLGARADLAKAADAAALAAAEQIAPQATLRVSYTDYRCHGVQDAASLSCAAASGQTDEQVDTGGAFAVGPGSHFGPLPDWAARAGCAGTTWPGHVAAAGVYRICTGQQLVSAGLSQPDHARMMRAAGQWLAANVQTEGQLYGARVSSVTVGNVGQVTVEAMAGVRPGLLMFRSVRVAETAWPGMAE